MTSDQQGPQETAEQQEQRVDQDLDALLADTARERDEYLELARRTKADFENYKKRAAKEAAAWKTRGMAPLARDVITVADDLERAAKASTDVDSELVNGIKLTLGTLQNTLEKAGVESYDPLGETFDPEWHEAMLTQPVPPEQDGKVVQVLAKGYRLDGQVLRPARVAVGKAEAEGADS